VNLIVGHQRRGGHGGPPLQRIYSGARPRRFTSARALEESL